MYNMNNHNNNNVKIQHIDVQSSYTNNNNINDDSNKLQSNQQLYNIYQCTVSLLKGIFGCGVLALPYSIKQCGIVTGVILSILLSILSSYTMKQLVQHKHIVSNIHHSNNNNNNNYTITYNDIVQVILGKQASYLVSIALLCSSMGVAVSYIDFCLCIITPLTYRILHIEFTTTLLLLTTVLIVLSIIRSNYITSITSLLGNISIIVCMIVVCIYGLYHNDILYNIQQITDDISNLLLHTSSISSFIGINSFTYAIHFFVLPIEQQTINQYAFNQAVNYTYIIACTVNVVFGLLGYLLYGNNVSSIILHNLSDKYIVSILVKLLMFIAIIFSYNIVLTPAIEYVENKVKLYNNNNSILLNNTIIVRVLVILFTILLSNLIPQFVTVCNLVGGICMISLAFIFTTLMTLRLDNIKHMLTETTYLFDNNINNNTKQYISKHLTTYERILNYIIFAFGLSVIFLTLYTNFIQALQLYTTSSKLMPC